MATTGDIPSNLTLTSSQAIRRNAADSAFEVFTPGAGSTGDVVGPASSGNGTIAVFDGITGKVIGDSGSLVSDLVNHSHSAGFVPVGGIIMWSGTVATIPANWHLCDGTVSTPDLRDKFIVGAKQDDTGVAKTNLTGSLTQSGGSTSHHHADHTVTQPSNHAAHTHSVTSNVTVADHASHTHAITQSAFTNTKFTTNVSGTNAHSGGGVVTTPSAGPSATLTHTPTNNAVTSGNPSATLTHSGTAVSTHDTLTEVPPYYALAFIMRTA
jgi:hypothetical protein